MMFLIESALRDMKNVDLVMPTLSTDEALWDIAAYHTQQAIEKLLKAILELKGMEYRKTHNLLDLINEIETMGIELNNELRLYAPLITTWETDSRYNASFKVLQKDLDMARKLYQELLDLVIGLACSSEE